MDRQSLEWLGEEDLAPQRRDRQIDANHGPAASRPSTRGADHGTRLDRAAVSYDSGDLLAAGLDVQHLAVHMDLRAVGPRGERITLDDALGGRVAVTPFRGVPYEAPPDDVIVSEADVAAKWAGLPMTRFTGRTALREAAPLSRPRR